MKRAHVLTMTAGLGWPQGRMMPVRGANPGFSGNGPDGFRRLFEQKPAYGGLEKRATLCYNDRWEAEYPELILT